MTAIITITDTYIGDDRIESDCGESSLLIHMCTRLFSLALLLSAHCEPGDADDNVEPPLLGTGVLERPHAVAVDVPEGARGRVHAALAHIDGIVACHRGLVDDALLHDRAVDGEPVRGRRGGFFGAGSADEGLQNSVLKIDGEVSTALG